MLLLTSRYCVCVVFCKKSQCSANCLSTIQEYSYTGLPPTGPCLESMLSQIHPLCSHCFPLMAVSRDVFGCLFLVAGAGISFAGVWSNYCD